MCGLNPQLYMSLQVVDIIDCFLLLNVLKDTMEGLESLDKAAWIKKKNVAYIL